MSLTNGAPTHLITHLPTGTTAEVPLEERLHRAVLQPGTRRLMTTSDKRYVAISFKKTRPLPGGRDLSREYIDFEDLEIRALPPRPVFDEEPSWPLGPGGEPRDCDDCAMCDRGDHHLCSDRNGCPQAIGW